MQKKNLSRLLQLEIKLRSCLFTEVGWFSSLYVKKYLQVVQNKDEKRIILTVSNKLKRLGVDLLELEIKDEPQVVFNLSDRNLSKTEFDLLKKGLEFECLYRQIRSFLTASNKSPFMQNKCKDRN